MNAMTEDQIELLSEKKTSQPKIIMQANGVTFCLWETHFFAANIKKREC